MTTYVVNGWRERYDRREGGRYYVCDECGRQEGYGHREKCSQYTPDQEDEHDSDTGDEEELERC